MKHCEWYLRTYLAWRKKPFPESFCTWKVFIRNVLVFVPMLRRYFRPDICHEYHELYLWKKNCHVEKFQLSIYDNCGKIEKKISAKWSTNCDSLTVFDLYNSSALSKWSWCVFESCRIHRQDQWKCRAKDRLNLPIRGHNNCGRSCWWAKPSDALDGADQDVIFVNATGSMQPPGDVIM